LIHVRLSRKIEPALLGKEMISRFCVCTLPFLVSSVTAAQIQGVILYRTGIATQTGNGQPAIGGYYSTASLFQNNSTDFSAASVTLPGGSTLPLSPTMPCCSPLYFSYSSPVTSLTNLNSSFPFGVYTYAAVDSPNQTASVDYTTDSYPTSIPYVTDFSSLSSFYVGAPFIVTWDPFTGYVLGGNNNPVVRFEIDFGPPSFPEPPPQVATPALFQVQEGPTSTFVEIPPGTLLPGITYSFQLTFVNEFPNGLGFEYITTGSFTTLIPEPPPALLLLGGLAALLLIRAESRRAVRAR
jgi:hypothetical protein